MEVVIVGAGAAGLSLALLLAKQSADNRIVVHERVERASFEEWISGRSESAYPIGVNARGCMTLSLIDARLEQAVKSEAGVVDAWCIHSNGRLVARAASGTVWGGTRNGVVRALYEEATTARWAEQIDVRFGSSLASIDWQQRVARFDDGSAVDFSSPAHRRRLVAADGVNSRARRSLADYYATQQPGFSCQLTPWRCSFRVLFSAAEPELERHPLARQQLDPRCHLIFDGLYAAVFRGRQWAFCIQILDDADADRFLADTVPSDDNVARLRAYVERRCAGALQLLSEQELRAFFTRRTFTGTVVQPSALNEGDWFALIGDAAHAVLPAIGEGINSALEDAMVLADCFRSAEQPFVEYNARRLDDVRCLTDYARYLADGWRQSAPERAARTATMIILSVAARTGLVAPSWNDKTFGVQGARREPYGQIYRTWRRQTGVLLPVARIVAHSVAFLIRWWKQLVAFCILIIVIKSIV